MLRMDSVKRAETDDVGSLRMMCYEYDLSIWKWRSRINISPRPEIRRTPSGHDYLLPEFRATRFADFFSTLLPRRLANCFIPARLFGSALFTSWHVSLLRQAFCYFFPDPGSAFCDTVRRACLPVSHSQPPIGSCFPVHGGIAISPRIIASRPCPAQHLTSS